MPTFTWARFHDKQKVVFDILYTPSEVGKITEVFRTRDGAKRSLHICHSVAAIGSNTTNVMGEGIRSFGKGSSFEQLYKLDSKILFLGVSFSVCTALHMVEEFMQVPYRYYRDFNDSVVIIPDTNHIVSSSTEFLRKPGYFNDFAKMYDVFLNEKVLEIQQVGEAKIICVRIKDVFDITKQFMEKDIGFLLTPESKSKLVFNKS